ncbi:MAG: hypothetical protein V3R20_02680 [Sphingomonadales bacterium]
MVDFGTTMTLTLGTIFPVVLAWLLALPFIKNRSQKDEKGHYSTHVTAALSPIKQAKTELKTLNQEINQNLGHVEVSTDMTLKRLKTLHKSLNTEAKALFETANAIEAKTAAVTTKIRQEREALTTASVAMESRLARLENLIAEISKKSAGDGPSRAVLVEAQAALDQFGKNIDEKMRDVTDTLFTRLEKLYNDLAIKTDGFAEKTMKNTVVIESASKGITEKAHKISFAASKAVVDLERAENIIDRKRGKLEVDLDIMEGRLEAFGKRLGDCQNMIATTLGAETQGVMDEMHAKTEEIEKRLFSLKEKFSDTSKRMTKQMKTLRSENDKLVASADKSAQVIDLTSRRFAESRKDYDSAAAEAIRTLSERTSVIQANTKELEKATQDSSKKIHSLAEKLKSEIAARNQAGGYTVKRPAAAENAAKASEKPADPVTKTKTEEDPRSRSVLSFRPHKKD